MSGFLLAHVAGVPVEELMLSAAGVGSALLVTRVWVALHVRADREGSS